MATEFIFKDHAVFRMLERGISEEEVMEAINQGECIETYGNDRPYPSRLMFKMVGGKPIHAVVANANKDVVIVVTTYIADTITFKEDFKTRR